MRGDRRGHRLRRLQRLEVGGHAAEIAALLPQEPHPPARDIGRHGADDSGTPLPHLGDPPASVVPLFFSFSADGRTLGSSETRVEYSPFFYNSQ